MGSWGRDLFGFVLRPKTNPDPGDVLKKHLLKVLIQERGGCRITLNTLPSICIYKAGPHDHHLGSSSDGGF